jgi:exonuclease VII large subunit
MAEGDFGRARDDLDSALALAPSREDLQQQLAALPAMESERQWRQRLAAARQQLDSGQFAAAAAGFGALLETAPADPAPARAGLQASVDGLLAQARSDLQEQRFDSAGSQLKVARQWLPDDPALAELAAELPRREQAWQAEQAAIAERNARANTQANTVLRAMGDGDLEEARRGYDSLRQEFPAMKVTRDLRERLLNAYREAVREEIEVQSYDTALALITEGQDLAPELALWGELREEVDDLEARDRRRLGAY